MTKKNTMAKVTSKRRVTIPKGLATQYGIRPGDEILWFASGDSIGIVPAQNASNRNAIARRLQLFDEATERRRRRTEHARVEEPNDRGWTRDELYDRGRPR